VKRRSRLVWIVSLSCLLGSAPLSAASFLLTLRETGEAVRFGQRSVVSEDFDREWKIDNASGESLTVVTPFLRLVQAARNAAFKSELLKPQEIDSLLKQHQGKLFFWASLRGRQVDFSRWHRPVLVSGKNEIKPSFVQNERTALRQEDGRFLSRSLYVFPTDGLAPKGRVTLVVRDKDEHEVAKFSIDLSAMR
jgi:hypothetical protein